MFLLSENVFEPGTSPVKVHIFLAELHVVYMDQKNVSLHVVDVT
jgi:hypothetical protein